MPSFFQCLEIAFFSQTSYNKAMAKKDTYYIHNPAVVKEVLVTGIAICVVLLGLGYVFGSSDSHAENTYPPKKETYTETYDMEEHMSISLVINTGSDIYIFQEDIMQGASVYDLMIKAADHHDFDFLYSEEPDGITVREIYNVPGQSASGWIYLINGRPMTESIDTYVIQPSDTIEWRLQ